MSQPRFLADHDLNERIIDGVLRREPAVEFTRLRDLGMSDRTDAEVLDHATATGLLVVSHDVSTMPAEAYARMDDGKKVSGLLMVSQMQPIGPIIDSLVLIWSASETEEWENQVVFLPI